MKIPLHVKNDPIIKIDGHPVEEMAPNGEIDESKIVAILNRTDGQLPVTLKNAGNVVLHYKRVN